MAYFQTGDERIEPATSSGLDRLFDQSRIFRLAVHQDEQHVMQATITGGSALVLCLDQEQGTAHKPEGRIDRDAARPILRTYLEGGGLHPDYTWIDTDLPVVKKRQGCANVTGGLFVLALLAILITPTVSLQADDAPRLRVLSYNIHYGQGNDGKYDIERLAEVIKRTRPDLVGLQEVDVVVERSGRVHQARRLGELTGMQVRYGPTQHYQGGLYGNAVLTKLPILDVHIQPLPYTEATPELRTYPRGVIAVTVRDPAGNPLRFLSTHFQHNLPEDRLAQARAINRLFAGDEIPTILAGDMNALPDAAPIAELLAQWSNATDEPPAPTSPATNPRRRIDYVFYRPAHAFELIEAGAIDEPMASDHRPVFAVLQLRAP